jgi:hypothetical protein
MNELAGGTAAAASGQTVEAAAMDLGLPRVAALLGV